MICEFTAAEVTEFCRSKHHPSSGDQSRTGLSPGRVLHEVQREEVTRLCVRQRGGSRFVDKLRGEDLCNFQWCVSMLDGIRLRQNQTALVALGIDADGNKHILDFVLGSNENLEIARELTG